MGDHVGDDPAAVAENRRRLALAVGVEPDRWVFLGQVHGTVVATLDGPPPAPPVADAAVTSAAGVALAVVTADCAPVALASDDAVAIAHAGHRGLLAGVLERTVGALRAAGRGRVRAVIGPCIRAARYEFSPHDLEPFVARFGAAVAGTTHDGRPALDLAAVARVALAAEGVDDVRDVGVCTASSPSHFSYRRDGRTGRQASVVVLGP